MEAKTLNCFGFEEWLLDLGREVVIAFVAHDARAQCVPSVAERFRDDVLDAA